MVHAIQWESGPDLGTEQKSLQHKFGFMAGTLMKFENFSIMYYYSV